MSLYEKLLEIQKRVDSIIKDANNASDRYDFASDENVLDRFRPMMDEFGLLLIPHVNQAVLHEGETKSKTTRFMTELWQTMVWRDVESGEELSVPWYSQGVDLAGEKGVGKALTYGEKYFLLKFFHVPTKKDDPDSDGRTRSGEKRQRGTASAKENSSDVNISYYPTSCHQCAELLFRKSGLFCNDPLLETSGFNYFLGVFCNCRLYHIITSISQETLGCSDYASGIMMCQDIFLKFLEFFLD